MKTVKISALALAIAGVFATSVHAQSAKTNAWEGADVAVSVGYGQFTPKIGSISTSALRFPVAAAGGAYTTASSGSATSSANDVTTATANISAGYNWGINSNYVLGIRATYYPGASSAASGSFTTSTAAVASPIPVPAGTTLVTNPISYNVKNLYSVVLTPGYAIDNQRLAYLKVGYTGSTIGINGPTLAYSTVNLSGYSLGVGYKQMVSESLYVLGEFNYAGFSNKTVTLTNTSGVNLTGAFGGSGIDFLVGLGYRF
ncbi:outer membrane protein [Polynucleobacter sp. MWH-Braz-FAM2G]|uniref:outer membrane protein n=1 Tax=Polynucleobacter sp. MWH-Braz-FAM2G TaxID=1855883 RepID=UPI001BFD244E|nr:hypothetical protein [Polynucleobacter sp. MWH-Braz-FAM2G]QWD91690.1 hypothetical protein FD973_05020 [Polynucleobacter sp. MWH-Braz-FAM2G]